MKVRFRKLEWLLIFVAGNILAAVLIAFVEFDWMLFFGGVALCIALSIAAYFKRPNKS
tara:strand:+ start:3709 stop:3882 length:174 start_codon:yes stop_codon:yes gene_type:complete